MTPKTKTKAKKKAKGKVKKKTKEKQEKTEDRIRFEETDVADIIKGMEEGIQAARDGHNTVFLVLHIHEDEGVTKGFTYGCNRDHITNLVMASELGKLRKRYGPPELLDIAEMFEKFVGGQDGEDKD